MLKKYFIPLLVLLVMAAGVVYWLSGSEPKLRDVRAAVPVEHFRLSNGLTVVVMPNTRIPAVTHLLMVKAGGADDPYGRSGVAHYNEHLMFTGTKAYPEGSYDKAVARVGGNQNAYTTKDYTGYFATVAKPHLEMVMAMEADRLQNPEFAADHAARELKVITEERNMRVENNAVAQLAEQLNAITFLNHPYHQPVIGWAEDMATFTAADAREFFTRYYRAGNMVLVLAGDITPREARRLAQKYYGAMPAGGVSPRNWPKEPPVRLVRHAEMEDAKVQQPQLVRQYVGPSAIEGNSAQALPLALFAQYLGGGETSVLYSQLVRTQKLASAVDVDYDFLSIGPAVFRITATPAAWVSLETLEAALDKLLAETLAATPDAAALLRSKTLMKAEVIYAQDGLAPLAHLMGRLYALGLDEQYFYEWANRMDAVGAQQMMEAANAVLKPNRRVTGYLKPVAAAISTAPAASMPVDAPAATEAPDAQ